MEKININVTDGQFEAEGKGGLKYLFYLAYNNTVYQKQLPKQIEL